MSANEEIWSGVPEPQQQANFIVDEPEDNSFSVLVDNEIAGYEVIEMIYLIGGVWRVTVQDTDDDEDVPSASLSVIVDRRFKASEVREAVIKLLENLYKLEAE